MASTPGRPRPGWRRDADDWLGVNVVPTLDQLAADPARAQGLPRAVLMALSVKIATLHMVVADALIVAPDLAGAGEDRLLTVPQIADRMGRKRSYVHAHADEWPFTLRPAGRLRFSLRGFQAWVAEQDGRADGGRAG